MNKTNSTAEFCWDRDLDSEQLLAKGGKALNPQQRSEAIRAAVADVIAKKNLDHVKDYTRAFNEVQRDRPDLFLVKHSGR